MKKYAERSEAKKNTEKLKKGLKSSILGPQKPGVRGGPGPLGPPPGSASGASLKFVGKVQTTNSIFAKKILHLFTHHFHYFV